MEKLNGQGWSEVDMSAELEKDNVEAENILAAKAKQPVEEILQKIYHSRPNEVIRKYVEVIRARLAKLENRIEFNGLLMDDEKEARARAEAKVIKLTAEMDEGEDHYELRLRIMHKKLAESRKETMAAMVKAERLENALRHANPHSIVLPPL